MNRSLLATRAVTTLFAAVVLSSCGGGGDDALAPAPSPPAPAPTPAPPPPNPAAVASIDSSDKLEVIARFRDTYLDSTARIWSGGSVAECRAGALNAEYRRALVKRVNYFRAMAGLPGDIAENEAANIEAQAAALLMDANSALSHNPPSTWKCYSEVAASGAANSNLCLGCARPPYLMMVTLFMDDEGDNNKPVGHRRWLLYSRLTSIGVGETDAASAVRIGGPASIVPASALRGIAWPNRGYTPRELFFPSGRWSFSCPNAQFGAATVDMRDAQGRPIVTVVESRTDAYGDSTIVWRVDLVSSPEDTWDPGSKDPAAETKITVTINSIVGCGSTTSQTYSTTIFRAS